MQEIMTWQIYSQRHSLLGLLSTIDGEELLFQADLLTKKEESLYQTFFRPEKKNCFNRPLQDHKRRKIALPGLRYTKNGE